MDKPILGDTHILYYELRRAACAVLIRPDFPETRRREMAGDLEPR